MVGNKRTDLALIAVHVALMYNDLEGLAPHDIAFVCSFLPYTYSVGTRILYLLLL